MGREEFLTLLRQSLDGEIPQDEIEKNINFYRNYFEEAQKPDSEVAEQLGSPALIAKTIIDAFRASKGPAADYYTSQARNEYSQKYAEYDDGTQEFSKSPFEQNNTSYHIRRMVLLFAVIAVVLGICVVLTVAGLFIRYILPILIVVLFVKIIINKTNSK